MRSQNAFRARGFEASNTPAHTTQCYGDFSAVFEKEKSEFLGKALRAVP